MILGKIINVFFHVKKMMHMLQIKVLLCSKGNILREVTYHFWVLFIYYYFINVR